MQSQSKTTPDKELEADNPVWDLVAEFLERRERGESIELDSFVDEHPEVGDRLREALAGFQWMEAKARPSHATLDEVLPRSFGNYELLRVIGRGGMGCVYEAFHHPLKRHVAVKVLPPHLTVVRAFRLRFLREAHVVASLHHTNIAPIFEVGQIGNTLYLAMPFIDGPNLRELTEPSVEDQVLIPPALRARLPASFTPESFRWVAAVGAQAADALAHAHGRGIVHRDIKPSNLLMDEHGAIWVVDFGLAKAPTHPTVTKPGELIGTLRYASPEQVQGDSFDTRTDIYSLGVTLYELLTRQPAFHPGPGHSVVGPEPVRPRRVNSSIPRDLETIVLRAMARRPEDRYATAAALADDLRRFLRDEPIMARPIGLVGRLVRWSRRNPAVTGVAAAAIVLLLAFAVFHYLRVEEQREKATRVEAISAERHAAWLQVSAEHMIDSGKPQRTRHALEMLREAAKIGFRDELWELALRAFDQVDVTPGAVLDEPPERIATLALNTKGNELACVDSEGKLRIWDTFSGAGRSCTGFGEPLLELSWSPDEEHLLGTAAKHVWVGKLSRDRRSIEDARAILYGQALAAFSPAGRYVALWGTNLSVWDVREGQPLWERPSTRASPSSSGLPYVSVAWSRDGKVLAAVPRGEAVIEFWGMPQGDRLLPIGVVIDEDVLEQELDRPIRAIGFSPDGSLIACGCADGAIRVFQWETGQLKHTLRGHDSPLRWQAFVASPRAGSEDGSTEERWILSADAHDVRLWDLARNQQVAVLVRDEELRFASVDHQGRQLSVMNGAGLPQLWRLPDLRDHQVVGPEPRRITALASAASSRTLAWADDRGMVSVTGQEPRHPRADFATGLSGTKIAFGPEGTRLAIAGEGDPPILIWTSPSGPPKPLALGHSPVQAIAFLNAGTHLAAAHADGRLVLWNIDTGQPYATVEIPEITSLASSPDGRWLSAGTESGQLHLWNAATMSHRMTAKAHESGITAIAFSPENASLVSGSKDGRVCHWRVPTLKRNFGFEGPGGQIRQLVFCLEGSTLALCGQDGRITLWASDRSTRVGSLVGRFTGRFDALAIGPNGNELYAAGGPKQSAAIGPGSVEVWNLSALRDKLVQSGMPDWQSKATGHGH